MKVINLTILITILMVSCTKEVEILNYFDQAKPFYLLTRTETGAFSSYEKEEILLNTEKHQLLLTWLSENNQDWKSTPASYNCILSINQKDFRLLIVDDLKTVVIGFLDENGEAKQYLKSIKEGELNFLIG